MTLAANRLTVSGRLDAVSCKLQPGKITAVCGPNGAGKSTLLSVLAGLTPPNSGQVLLKDTPILSLPHRMRAQRIGYLPQDGEVAWDVAVRGLVALGRMPHGDTAAEPVNRALAALDLDELADRPVSRISGGERARALLARVMAGEPDWILADEPLAALDLGHQLVLLRHLHAMAAAGAGIVLVVHDLSLAMNHADHVIILENGQLAAADTPERALSLDTIEKIWCVQGRWHGEPGERAFSTVFK